MAGTKREGIVFSGNDYESVTVADTAIGCTAAKAARAELAFITAETAQMRFRYDGTAPTATEGHVLEPGETLTLKGTLNVQNFLAIRTSATSGVLRITYEV